MKTPVLVSFLKRLWHRCFPVNIATFLKTPFFTKHLRWLLLSEQLKEVSLDDKLESLIVCTQLKFTKTFLLDSDSELNSFSLAHKHLLFHLLHLVSQLFNMKIKKNKDLYNINNHLYEDSIQVFSSISRICSVSFP